MTEQAIVAQQAEKQRLALATSSITENTIKQFAMNGTIPSTVPGFYDGSGRLDNYRTQVKLSRWFYENDTIAGTVINRMSDMAITRLKNKRTREIDDLTYTYYEVVAERLRPFIKHIAMEFLVNGMVVPAYTYDTIRGNLLRSELGRKRFIFPDKVWARNVDNIELRRKPIGMDRQVWLKIPKEDIELITTKGYRSDGTYDVESYLYLVENFPDYVTAVKNGKSLFLLEDIFVIARKITSYKDYPLPYLVNAIPAMQHKLHIKTMDRSLASRVIEAVRHVKTGNDEYPAQVGDLNALEIKLQNTSNGERIYNLITNHTTEMSWIIPPLEALLSETKYIEPNADIFLALGFPRVLTVGETQRSNSSDSKVASLGPKATLEDMRDGILEWIKVLYRDLADKNGFTNIPIPYLSQIITSDYTALIQFSKQALDGGSISQDTVAQLYGSDFETESEQIQIEIDKGILTPAARMAILTNELSIKMQTQKAKDNAKLNAQNPAPTEVKSNGN